MNCVDTVHEWNDKKGCPSLHKRLPCAEQQAAWTSVFLLVITFTGLAIIAWGEYKTNIRLKSFDLNYEGNYFGVIADIHLDMESNWTHCQNGSSVEGIWISHYENVYGGRFCDSSRALLDLTLRSLQIMESEIAQPFEFLVLLGDNSGHFTENTDTSIQHLKYVKKSLSQYFPHTPVYFTLGNHGLVTADQSNWYKQYWEVMSPGLQKSDVELADAMKTFQNFGFYMLKHNESLWVVSLNTNILMQPLPDELTINTQFEWLDQTLIEARNLGTVGVMLIGHSSPDIPFTRLASWTSHKEMTWKSEYILKFNEIIAPHWNIIKLSFFAHQHANSWFVKKFTPQDYISYFKFPSVSMSDYGDPSFAVGVVNEKDWGLLDLVFYFCPLEIFTRLDKIPSFSFQYSFKQQNFVYNDRDAIIDAPAMKAVTDRIISFADGMETYTNVIMNIYQLSFKPHISPYQAYCMLTENLSDHLEICLNTFY